MIKPFPIFCNNCKYSKPEERSEWCLRCYHPLVNANDAWALSSANTSDCGNGTNCHDERGVRWFAKCGMKGKLWEPK